MTQQWINKLASRFIVFDGPDGSGKSTQFSRFAAHCAENGITVCEVREPGGTSIGEQIRRVLLDPANTEMALRCEMMLYMASRAQLVEQIIRPAMARNELVLADRFISSTLAYQGNAGGLSEDEILAVGNVAVGDTWPELTVVFDVDEATATARMTGSPKRSARAQTQEHGPGLFEDRMERQGAEYRRLVREGYLKQAEAHPDKYIVIDARKGEDDVFAALLKAMEQAVARASRP